MMLTDLNLTANDAQCRHLFETMPQGVIYLDELGRVTDGNPSAERIVGLNLGEMLGRCLADQGLRFLRESGHLLGDDELPFSIALRTGERVKGAMLGIYNPRRRQYRWVAVEVVPQVRLGGLKPWQLCAFLTDVTEHRRVRERMLQGEAQFRLLAENSTDLISRHAPDGRFLYVSPAARLLLGYEPEELLEQTTFELVHEEDHERMAQSQRELLGQGGDVTVACRFRRCDGTYRWLETTSRLVVDPQSGEVVEIQAASRDITERKETEEALHRLSVAVEQSPASVVITDTSGSIEYVNRKFEEVTGYTLAEVLGQNPRVLKSGMMERGTYEALWAAIRNGQEWRGEFHNQRKNGELYWESAVVSPIKDDQGRVTHFLAVKEDITERKRAEELRRHLETQLRESQKLEAFGQLAGGIAHDFNNILTVICSHACLLQEGRMPESDRAESVREIARSAQRATNLTSQLLAFSRRQLLQPRDLDLNEVITSMARMLERLIGEHIRLESFVSSRGSPVHADAGMMEQVILNLVVNARDAMPKSGKLRVGTECVRLAERDVVGRTGARAGDFVCLMVSDTGCGIAPENVQRVFEPFFTTKEVGKGTGLGLATVLGIVKQHQGWIELETGLEAGTTFRVFLPRLEMAVPQPRRLPVVSDVQGGNELILVVEDEDPLRILVRTVLERQGYRVLEASDGRQGLQMWEQHRYKIQLLLTDMVMPEGISGIELAHQLQDADPALKVVFTTGYSEQSFDTSFRRRGSRFLPKPYDPMRLARAVRECLDGIPVTPAGFDGQN